MSEEALYTVLVNDLIEINFNFGLDKYPIFDENYRAVLNIAILEHYRWHEIGYQNPIMWRNRLQTRLNRIMRDKYNALYEAKKTEFNPLYNVDMTETFTHEIENITKATNNTNEDNNNTNTSNSTTKTDSNGNVTTETKNNTDSKGNSLVLNSQYPSEEMTEDDLTDNIYIDHAQKTTNEGEENSTSNVKTESENTDTTSSNSSDITTGKRKLVSTDNANTNTIETYTRKQEGSSAGLPFSKAMIQLKEFYDKYQLDKQVIDELKDLFISLW